MTAMNQIYFGAAASPAMGRVTRRPIAIFAAIIIALLCVFASAGSAIAHPMGNFSINHYSKIVAGTHSITIDYLIDMAEIPTFQEIQDYGFAPKAGGAALDTYLARQADRLKQGLALRVDGRALPLTTLSRQVIFPPGAGGLPTMKLGFVYEARLPKAAAKPPLSIGYRDGNFPNRAGWKEIIAVAGPGAALVNSSVPSRDRSAELSNYPTDLLHSPPQALEAALEFEAARGAPMPRMTPRASHGFFAAAHVNSGVALEANQQGTPRSAFTELVKSERGGVLFLAMAALIAAALGGFHALEPGHGKTLVAAYLVGSHAKARHAVLLGGIVTASHTISVYLLGLITLYASQWIVPERLYPWLGASSGLLVAGIGFSLFVRRFAPASPAHAHSHSGDHQHVHSHHHGEHPHGEHPHHHHDRPALQHRHTWWGGHVHEEPEAHDHHEHQEHHAHRHDEGAAPHSHSYAEDHRYEAPGSVPAQKASLRSLFALGVTGGIVPCPAALVVLLGALAIHRVAFGLFLIVAFSVGLAGVLISFGLAMVYARRLVSRFGAQGPLTERWMPLASSAVITVVGVTITIRSLISAGIIRAAL